jgi:Ser/Thr protein kinase RdoA (MazF antagonist)
MLLNTDTVVHYALQKGFLNLGSVVDGDLTVVEAHRRNRNFKLTQQHHAGLFVKQVQQLEPQAMATLQRESVCYSIAREIPEFASLAELLPGFCAYDPVRHVLVLELLSGYETLSEYHYRLRAFPVEVATLLAKALGNYHRDTREKLETATQASVFPKMAPWALSIHQQQPEWFQSLSAANSQLLQIVKQYGEFASTLGALRADWHFGALIHGDMKWDNCLIKADGKPEGKPVLKIVDWELSDLGDPLWDVAAILQSYLSYWILSMPVTPGLSIEQIMAGAPWPLETLQVPMRAFWNTYREVAAIPKKEKKTLLLRSIRYGAARMIQTAYESLSFAMQVNSNALYLLQVSMNVLLNPDEAASELFGITEA